MIIEIIEHDEKVTSNFEGTIIDIETIGEFNEFHKYDSRRYKEISQVILGYLNRERLHIYCAKDVKGIKLLKEMTQDIIEDLGRPFYAFNSEFESGVWFNHIGIEILFDGELQRCNYEKKRDAVGSLNIPNYNDPFFDDGLKCLKAWKKGGFDKAIAHNRACLLKERDILINRGYRNSNILKFVQ